MSDPFLFLRDLWPWSVADWSPDWTGPRDDEDLSDDLRKIDADECASERTAADAVTCKPGERLVVPVVDLEDRAAGAKYGNGKIKRTRYRRVRLAKRRVIVVLHQTGVERGENRWGKSAHRVTCHRLTGPTGTRYRVHPIDRRLVASNKLDRKPFHAINIELGGNFEGQDGSGRWYKPDTFGRGRAGDAQIEGARQEIASLRVEVEAQGGELVAVVPHLVSGRNRAGKPNRQIDCGDRVWRMVGEWSALEFGLAVPGEGQAYGGLPIYGAWRGDLWDEIKARGLAGM